MFKSKNHIRRGLPAILLVIILLVWQFHTYIRQQLPFGKYSLRVAKEWARKDSLRVVDSLKRAGADNKALERMPTDSMKRVISEKKVFEKALTDSLMSLEATYLPEGETASRYYIIIGSFSNHSNTEQAAKKYSSKGFKTAIIPKPGNNTNNLEMVSVKTFTDRDKASLFLKEFKGKYDPNAWIYSGN